MTMILIVDTETTGFPLFGKEHPADAPYQPRMCEIACALFDDSNEVDPPILYRSLIKPENWPLDDERFVANMNQARDKSHGYSLEKLMNEGIPVADAHKEFRKLYDQCQIFSGFNVWFDHKIVRGEAKRLGHQIPFRDRQGICVMKAARPLCGLGKNPKLSEAVQILLGRVHDTAHSADGDVAATVDLYRYIKVHGELRVEDQPGGAPHG